MIYYPHYTPSKLHLRSILLFSDSLKLIVPSVDQGEVELRSHVSEILNLEPNLVQFKDPEFRYTGWAEKKGINRILVKLLREVEQDIGTKEVGTISKDCFGHAKYGQEELIRSMHEKHRWRYVALEKLPSRIHTPIFESNAAALVGIYRNPVTGRIVEHNGVLCHPKLADFILSRMAREASFVEGDQSITFDGLNYMNHLFDEEPRLTNVRHALFQSSIDLFLPDNLEQISASEYISIRKDFLEVRQALWQYLNTIGADKNLDLSEIDQRALLQNISEAREKISNDLDEAKRSIGRNRFQYRASIALDLAATMAGAALGAMFDGAVAAAVGAGLAQAMGLGARKMSTVEERDPGVITSIAMTKAKVERKFSERRWNAPSHWLE